MALRSGDVGLMISCSEEEESTGEGLHREIKEFRSTVKESFAEQRELLMELLRSLHGHAHATSRQSASSQLGAAVEVLHEHDTWRPPKEFAAPSVPTQRRKSGSEDQQADLSQPRNLNGAEDVDRSSADPGASTRYGRRQVSDSSLLSLESAPDKASPRLQDDPDLMKSPSSVSKVGTEKLLQAFAGSPNEAALDEGTETFVTSQMYQQQRKAESAARAHTERRMSYFSTYNSERADSKTLTRRAARRAERIVASPCFTYGILSVILTNMILLGIEVDVTSRLPQNEIPPWFVLANAAVVLIFVSELTTLFLASGCKNFFCGPDRSWNIFDFSIISWSVLETCIELWTTIVATPEAQVSASHLRFARTMRLVRAFRGVRVVRLLRYISALRTLVLSIISSMASLCWTLALLVLLFYCFGIVFTQLVWDYCRDEAVRTSGDVNVTPLCPNNVDHYWATVPESMLTLFTAITGGMNWEEAMVSLRLISPLAASCFIFYIAIAVLAVVNVAVGR
ncbi:unnamed protein product [Symbiodinium natans]|uniref:Ion transport domain-containing protein n=1 Tax=Symbiodinium natans TaxID=878477 RepID=A0A812QXW1_9DINO|nr:unnamed protein product [Symbiodinium natans]